MPAGFLASLAQRASSNEMVANSGNPARDADASFPSPARDRASYRTLAAATSGGTFCCGGAAGGAEPNAGSAGAPPTPCAHPGCCCPVAPPKDGCGSRAAGLGKPPPAPSVLYAAPAPPNVCPPLAEGVARVSAVWGNAVPKGEGATEDTLSEFMLSACPAPPKGVAGAPGVWNALHAVAMVARGGQERLRVSEERAHARPAAHMYIQLLIHTAEHMPCNFTAAAAVCAPTR